MNSIPALDLALFADAAPTAAVTGETAGGTASAPGSAIKAGNEQKPGVGHRAGKSGGLKNVVYGRAEEAQEATAAGSTQENSSERPGSEAKRTLEDRREKFRQLISTEYKDLYAEEFQEAFNRRFKGYKAQGERLASFQPIIESLMARYQIEDGDMARLAKALESDTAYLEKKAGQANMPVVQYKAIEQLRHENALMKAAQKEARTGEAVGGQLQKWLTEGERIKADYPGFDLAGESKNPRFLALLRSGVPMVHAYEVLHLGDIKQGVASETARQTEKRVVDGIRAKGTRPLENGMSSGSGIVVKSDVSRLTKKDRQEIAKRALQGEKISF